MGDGAASNLVLALKGQSPFGADLPDPPAGASINRMPSGRDAVEPQSIKFIEQWIDDGCPEDETPALTLSWRATNAPVADSRTDDVWFIDEQRGWAVNSSGEILHTEDGFNTWERQFHDPQVYFRCVGFASESRGWVGTLTAGKRLFDTVDGGATWTNVAGLPPLAPSAICGLSVVDASVVYASGTNYPNRPARMMRTLDGGASWEGWDMAAHATLLVDTYFTDADHGWVVGGKAGVPNPTRNDVHAVVLRTEDGGKTWVNKAAALSAELPLGEWGWKIQFLDDRIGYVALESFTRGAVLKTTDGGDSWTRIDVNDPQGNVNLEGVGFIDESTGWVGGWGVSTVGDPTAGFSSATTDSGKTWQNANEIGRFINRFRFFGNPVTVGYASGLTVYQYSAEPAPALPAMAREDLRPRLLEDNTPRTSAVPVRLVVTVPDGAERLMVDIWDRFGEHARQLTDESDPTAGPTTIEWDGTDSAGQPADGAYILRVTVDDQSESQIVHITR